MGPGGYDRNCCAELPELGRPQRRQLARSVQRRQSLWLLVLLAARILQTKQIGEFFLDLNDGFGALELRFQAFDSTAQGCIFIGQRIGLRAALFGRQRLQSAFRHLLTPMSQVRRIESLTAKKGSYLAGLRAGVGFLKYSPLVFGGKLTSPSTLNYLRKVSQGILAQRAPPLVPKLELGRALHICDARTEFLGGACRFVDSADRLAQAGMLGIKESLDRCCHIRNQMPAIGNLNG